MFKYIIQVDREKPDSESEIKFIKHFGHCFCFIIVFK
jgi:hypothetical protein